LELKNIFVENTMFEQLQSPLPKVLITRAVRIDKKLLNEMKKKKIVHYYAFLSEKPENIPHYGYILPDEKKERYVARKEAE